MTGGAGNGCVAAVTFAVCVAIVRSVGGKTAACAGSDLAGSAEVSDWVGATTAAAALVTGSCGTFTSALATFAVAALAGEAAGSGATDGVAVTDAATAGAATTGCATAAVAAGIGSAAFAGRTPGHGWAIPANGAVTGADSAIGSPKATVAASAARFARRSACCAVKARGRSENSSTMPATRPACRMGAARMERIPNWRQTSGSTRGSCSASSQSSNCAERTHSPENPALVSRRHPRPGLRTPAAARHTMPSPSSKAIAAPPALVA